MEPTLTPSREPARPLSFRPTKGEDEALNLLAARMGVPRSAIVRAGIRAVWAWPELVWSAPPVGAPVEDDRPDAPPPPPRAKKRRRR